MKFYKSKRLPESSIRIARTDEGGFLGTFGRIADLEASGIITPAHVPTNWDPSKKWVLIRMNEVEDSDGTVTLDIYETRDEIINELIEEVQA